MFLFVYLYNLQTHSLRCYVIYDTESYFMQKYADTNLDFCAFFDNNYCSCNDYIGICC